MSLTKTAGLDSPRRPESVAYRPRTGLSPFLDDLNFPGTGKDGNWTQYILMKKIETQRLAVTGAASGFAKRFLGTYVQLHSDTGLHMAHYSIYNNNM
jgi:hypothetical protein